MVIIYSLQLLISYYRDDRYGQDCTSVQANCQQNEISKELPHDLIK